MRDNEKKKRYLNGVAEKISDNKMKSEIAVELDTHIDERAQFYEEIGYSEEEAFEKAVEQMGDPDAVGTSLSRLHPQGKTWKSVVLILLLFLLLSLFGLITIVCADEGEMGRGLLEVLLLLCFIGVSRFAQKNGSLFLSIMSPLLFFLTYGWFALIVCDTSYGFHHLCSPIILTIFCIVTNDFTCLYTFPRVGGVTVAPWLTYVSIAFYVLIFLLLIAMAVSVKKLYRPTYSLFDKRAGKVLTVIAKSVCAALALCTLVSQLPFKTPSENVGLSNYVSFDYVVVLQSNSPCAIEDIPPEDVWIVGADYDWGNYILSWDYENDWSNWDTIDPSQSIYTYHSASITVPCGNKLCYVVQKEILECKVNKPYVSVHFIQWDYARDHSAVEYSTLSEYLPEMLEWQESKAVGTVSATVDAYNCVDVIINAEA